MTNWKVVVSYFHKTRFVTFSQFLAKPRVPCMQTTSYILQCVKATLGQGLFYSSSYSISLKGFVDLDWATYLDIR